MWFRFHVESLNDPKVQQLPAELFKMWVNLLCLAKKHNGTLPSEDDCSFALRETKEAFHERFIALQEAGLFDKSVTDDETFHPHNWNKRQYKSDTSTERVKAHRKRTRNVTVTPPETETEAETDSQEPRGSFESAREPVEVQAEASEMPDIPAILDQRKSPCRKTALPKGWADNPIPAVLQTVRIDLPPSSREPEWRKFTDSALAHGRKYADWGRAWSNWLARAPDFARAESQGQRQASSIDRMIEEADEQARSDQTGENSDRIISITQTQ